MIYVLIPKDPRFTSNLIIEDWLQEEIKAKPTDNDKFAIAIVTAPRNDSNWYFYTPDQNLSTRGLDDASTASECIMLFDSEEKAIKELDSISRKWSSLAKAGIFRSTYEENGNLLFQLWKEIELEKTTWDLKCDRD